MLVLILSSANPSLKGMTGSLTVTSQPLANLSSKSFKHRSRCNSPATQTINSPDSSSTYHSKTGSALANKSNPRSNFASFIGFVGSTAIFIIGLLWIKVDVEAKLMYGLSSGNGEQIVAFLSTALSNPTTPTILPAGTFSILTNSRPMIKNKSLISTSLVICSKLV